MNKYWYHDCWSGKSIYFSSLKKAIVSAKEQDGVSVAIYNKDGVCAFVDCKSPIHYA